MSGVSFGGVPVAPDVNALMEHIGVPEPGNVIEYDAVEVLIEVDRGTGRWKTVTDAWRKRLFREHNLVVVCQAGEAFRVLTEPERVTHSHRGLRTGLRATQRGLVVGMTTDREKLESGDRRKLDHLCLYGQRMLITARQELGAGMPKPPALSDVSKKHRS